LNRNQDTNRLRIGANLAYISAMLTPKKAFAIRKKGRKGQTLVEYALILAFISVVAISVLIDLGTQVKHVFSTISSQLSVAGASH